MSEHDNKDIGFFEQLARIQWLLHRYRLQKYREFGPMGDPHRGQGRVLSLLKLKPEISQKDLGYLLNMRPQSLGELLGKLERAGYITRSVSDTDRRILNIKLTEEGKKAADAKDSTEIDSVFDCLTPEDQNVFGDYLNRVIASLEKMIGDEQPEPDFGFGWGFDGPQHKGFEGPPNDPGQQPFGCNGPMPSGGHPHPGFGCGPMGKKRGHHHFCGPFGMDAAFFGKEPDDDPETPPECL